ncbi:hypothetical protein CTI12_AA220930 [Artemisia annua]|uniref:Uncharacterized protein n=1 Tax=Artemisia annua TaxID=35608 RepID=A0A2U1NWC7_ARTAN|nr:hypothetical protein CTI12_AA220930 [Artemisia annua]
MTAVKYTPNDAESLKKMMSLKILKEIETDQESNASSSEDTEYYSPKSVVVKKWSRGERVYNPVERIRCEDSLIGEDFIYKNKFVSAGRLSRPASPLGNKK